MAEQGSPLLGIVRFHRLALGEQHLWRFREVFGDVVPHRDQVGSEPGLVDGVFPLAVTIVPREVRNLYWGEDSDFVGSESGSMADSSDCGE